MAYLVGILTWFMLISGSYGQTGTFHDITRGADTSEIYLTTFCYIDDAGFWGGIFRSTDNGKNLELKHKYDYMMNRHWIYGDSASGTIYLKRYSDTLQVSHDFGASFDYKPSNDNGSGLFASGCKKGEFYIGNMSLPAHSLNLFTEYGDSVHLINSNYNSIHLMDVGTMPGELFAMKYPYYIDTIGIAYSNDSGHSFSEYYQDTSILANLHKYTWSRGTVPGELYMAAQDPMTYSWHIFHSTDYGHTLTLKHITEPPVCLFTEKVSFTAGRTPGSCYMLWEFEDFSRSEIWIDYSQDYGQTFTQYCHILDSTFTGVSVSRPGSDLVFYPNPAWGQITVETRQKPGQLTVEIFDLAGKRLTNTTFETAGEKSVISLAALTEGIYFIRFRIGEAQPVVRKLVVRRE